MDDVVKASGDQTQAANPIEVQKFLKGVSYPTTRENLVDVADREGADEIVLRTLEKLPMETFSNPNEVTEWIAKE